MKHRAIIAAFLFAFSVTPIASLAASGDGKSKAEESPEQPGRYTDERYLTLAPLLVSVIHHDDVEKLVSLIVTVELTDRSKRIDVERLMPRLRDAYLSDLTKMFSLLPFGRHSINLPLVKRQLRAASDRVLGQGVVRDVLVLNAVERPV